MPATRKPSFLLVALALAAASATSACANEEPTSALPPQPATGEISSALVSYDCNASVDTGYKNGQPFAITVVTLEGFKAERDSANAFLTMAEAAEGAGVSLRLSDGFRTMAEQEYYWGCYQNQNCNDGNKAAPPGYSNHQSGHAVRHQDGGRRGRLAARARRRRSHHSGPIRLPPIGCARTAATTASPRR